MTTEDRYVRGRRPISREQVADTVSLVDTWLDQLDDLRELAPPEAPNRNEYFYDLMSLWGRLLRVRPALLADLDGAGVLAWAESTVERLRAEEMRAALAVPDPGAWLLEAKKPEVSREDWIDADRAGWAESVMTDLDDAELALCIAEDHGVVDDELADRLASCVSWLVGHTDVFLAAGAWIDAVGRAMRPELPEEHPGLALTAEKFVRVLEALDDAEFE